MTAYIVFKAKRAHRSVVRAIKIARACSRDGRIPRALRWFIIAGVVAGPFIIGPVDEILVCVAVVWMLCRYPAIWAEHRDQVLRNEAKP